MALSVVTRGYLIGSIALVVTRGYVSGEAMAAAVTAAGAWYPVWRASRKG